MNIESELVQFKVKITYDVQWGDMDAANHVNNINYLRWCETARIAYFAEMNMDLSFSEGVGPILGWQDCKYIFPLTFPDQALIACRVESVSEDRFTMECRVYSIKHDRLCAISNQVIIPYDYEGLTKAAIPSSWIESINKIEGKTI